MSVHDHPEGFPSEFMANVPDEHRHAMAPSSMERVEVSTERIPRGRILCADDEVEGSTTRAEILREHGYSVVLHHSPPAVLSCDLSAFDLAILDFHMPGMNGRELFLRMRALGARYPIVLLTGGLDALSHEDRVLFARCIDKSLPMRHVLDTIAEFLDPNQVPDYGM